MNFLRIDRYVLGMFWLYFISALGVFVTLFVAVDAMSTMVSYTGVASRSLLEYYFAFAPEVIHKMLPVAALLGSVMTLTTLNRSNELVALFASGMSLMRIAAPILVSTFLISFVAYYMSDQVLPASTRQKNFIFYNDIRKTPGMFSVVKTNRIWYRSKNTIFNIKTLNPEVSRAQGLTMYYFDDAWNLLQMITAQDVFISGSRWNLKNGSVTVFSAESSFPLNSSFKEKTVLMDEGVKDLTSAGQTSDMLSQEELAYFIEKNKSAGLDTLRYEVDYHAKYAFSLAGLVMVLLGLPFSVGKARSGGVMKNLGTCLALVFSYWVLYSSSLTLGSHGQLPPFWAAWLPNGLMIASSVFIIKKKRR